MKYIFALAIVFVLGLGLGWYVWGKPQTTMPMVAGSMDMNQSSMATMMDDMTGGLATKTGDAFDKTFLDTMIVHHQGAVAMARMVLVTSRRPELKIFAQGIIDAQTKEIGQMEAWRAAWFK